MVREVEQMPWEGEYPAQVTSALLRYGTDTLAYTQSYYEVRNAWGDMVLGAGVAVWSYVRPPELWIMLAKPYFINLRDSLRLTREAMELPRSQYEGLVCDVAKHNKVERHFVEFMGWAPTGRRSLRPNGDNFVQYGVI